MNATSRLFSGPVWLNLFVVGVLGLSLGAKLLTEWRSAAQAAASRSTNVPDGAEDGERALILSGELKQLYDMEQILSLLSPQLARLDQAIATGRLPGETERDIFGSLVTIKDVGGVDASSVSQLAAIGRTRWSWQVDSFDKPFDGKLDIWARYLESVDRIDHAHFHFLDGRLTGPDTLTTRVAFRGAAFDNSNAHEAVRAEITLIWSRTEADRAGWKITHWETESFFVDKTARPLFQEVLTKCVPDSQARSLAQRSLHEELASRILTDENTPAPHEFFWPMSWDRHPGIAVCDVDGNGWDDLYVVARRGKNQLFLNQGNGTFLERASAWGVDIEDHCSSALFADFDNDGDADLLVGRTLAATEYFRNDGQHFTKATNIDGRSPGLVSSLAAVDYDGDGLLDVYVSTYAAQVFESRQNLTQFISQDDVAHLEKTWQQPQHHEFVNLAGPRNVLLHNEGNGRFKEVVDTPLNLFRHTYHAGWADYDNDGDQDVYCANDFAPDNLFRNEGGGKFVDVTDQVGLSSFGFGKGASWGDYDNDGQLDLYVSNMSNTTGRRITDQIDSLDSRIRQATRGNCLYGNRAGSAFDASNSPLSPVNRAGWSWCGQFSDFNNDGRLDLYVLSGFYTSPPALRRVADTSSQYWRTVVQFDQRIANALRNNQSDAMGGERGDSLSGRERNHLFLNLGDGEFADVSDVSGADHPADGRAWSILDYNRDGYVDLAVVNANAPKLLLYENQMSGISSAPSPVNNYVAFRLVGGNHRASTDSDRSNRDGIGTRIKLRIGNREIVRERQAGAGFAAQNSATLVIGIGSNESVDEVVVDWPSEKEQSLYSLPARSLVTVREYPETGERAVTIEPYERTPVERTP